MYVLGLAACFLIGIFVWRQYNDALKRRKKKNKKNKKK